MVKQSLAQPVVKPANCRVVRELEGIVNPPRKLCPSVVCRGRSRLRSRARKGSRHKVAEGLNQIQYGATNRQGLGADFGLNRRVLDAQAWAIGGWSQ
jgi:hypothetical protein